LLAYLLKRGPTAARYSLRNAARASSLSKQTSASTAALEMRSPSKAARSPLPQRDEILQ
jgi:hypothetical protein